MDDVDLLAGVLADVRDVEVTGLHVEGGTPGVAETVVHDLVVARGPDERVVRGDGIAAGDAVDVDAKDLAVELVGDVLGVALGVVGSAAVTGEDPEVPVGAEAELAAVVVRVGLVDGDHRRSAGAVRHLGVAGDRVPGDLDTPAVVRVIDVEVTVRLVLGVEGHAEKTLLAAGAGPAAGDRVDVQEVRRTEVVLGDAEDANRPRFSTMNSRSSSPGADVR